MPSSPNHDPSTARRHGRRGGADPSGRRCGGERICVHGDYDVDGICATALAVLILRELGADVEWHLPSRFEEGYGLAGETIEQLAADGVGLVLTVDCGITAVDEVAARARARAGRDRHRSPPAGRRAARLPDRRHAAVRLSVSRALRYRRRLQARPRRCSATTTRLCAGTSISSRSRRSPTSCRSSTRTERSRPPACARSRARPARAARRSCSPRGSIRRPSTPPPSASGSRRGSTRPAGSAAPTSPSSCSSPRMRAKPTRLAAELERLNRERQAVEERILREAVARRRGLAGRAARRVAATSSGARTGTRA